MRRRRLGGEGGADRRGNSGAASSAILVIGQPLTGAVGRALPEDEPVESAQRP